ncbi:hypothetical protein PtB15_13B549 [Puccinia triticina]|nr:hypothetical protein PtB15_1B626 [Puccinia triticina]WAR61294.1 hypothetical protein PtB15_13B549 [Puccinia triticina]
MHQQQRRLCPGAPPAPPPPPAHASWPQPRGIPPTGQVLVVPIRDSGSAMASEPVFVDLEVGVLLIIQFELSDALAVSKSSAWPSSQRQRRTRCKRKV